MDMSKEFGIFENAAVGHFQDVSKLINLECTVEFRHGSGYDCGNMGI